jgi:uncharacterized protein
VSTGPSAAYVDSSALVKLVIPEPETGALRTELARWQRHVASAIARVEVIRACVRVDDRARPVAEAVLDALDLIAVDDELLKEAARVEPVARCSLDAIHVASALLIRDALGVVVSYDERLLAATQEAGLPTAAPR